MDQSIRIACTQAELQVALSGASAIESELGAELDAARLKAESLQVRAKDVFAWFCMRLSVWK